MGFVLGTLNSHATNVTVNCENLNSLRNTVSTTASKLRARRKQLTRRMLDGVFFASIVRIILEEWKSSVVA